MPAAATPQISSKLEPRPPLGPSALTGVIISESKLQHRIEQLADQINHDYQNQSFVAVGILTGSFLFFADLIRRLKGSVEIDFLGLSSYRQGTTAGKAEFTQSLKSNLANRNVLAVDDILDGGQTLATIVNRLQDQQPTDVRSCVLLERTDRRQTTVQADYIGFRIPDCFVVGYGLDYAEQYRNLPYVGVLDETRLSGH